MKNKIKNKIKPSIKHFSFFEFLIILIAIGILSFVTYRQFIFARDKSRDLQRRSDLHEFSKVILNYFNDYHKLPETKLINSLWGKEFIDSNYTYAKSVPSEKYGKKEYCYDVSADGLSFKMFADFDNKKDKDCKKDGNICQGVKYCYTDIIYVNKTTEE